MDYLKTNLKWEDFFIQESVDLDEKMSSFEMDALSKSKLRLAIENKILSWEKYESWVLQNLGCSSLKSGVSEKILKNFGDNAKQAFDIYSNYDFWSEDLLPVFIWENQLIVFGLQYNENLVKIEGHIFILAPPEALAYFSKLLFNKEDSDLEELEDLEKSIASKTMTHIEGLVAEVKPPVLDFKGLVLEPTVTNHGTAEAGSAPEITPDTASSDIWDFINERHEEYSFEAKKQFSAYVVLRISAENITKVFKMDPDLEAQQTNPGLFEYKLSDDNPFKRVFESGVSESFSVSQLGLQLHTFKYACITALKRSDKVVGFLVGFKEKNLSESDQSLLEELAKESAA